MRASSPRFTKHPVPAEAGRNFGDLGIIGLWFIQGAAVHDRIVGRIPSHPVVAASPSSARLSPGTLRDESPFAASTWCCIPSGDPPGAAGYGLGPCGILPRPASWSLVLHSLRGTLGHTSRASVLYPFG